MIKSSCVEPGQKQENSSNVVVGGLMLVLVLAILIGFVPLVSADSPEDDPAKVGRWSGVIELSPSVVAIHAHLLPTGKVLLWSRWAQKPEPENLDTWLWDPVNAPSGKLEKIHNNFVNVFCSGHTFLPDGTLLVAGGHKKYDDYGVSAVTLFNPSTGQWSKAPQGMKQGRWYPTTCALPNGGVFVSGGTVSNGVFNSMSEVWKKEGGWQDLTGAKKATGVYPWLLSAPDGRVFWAGPNRETQYLDPSGTGKWFLGPASNFGLRDYGSAVLYEPGKVLIVGGGQNPPTATAETIDLNAPTPQWQQTGSMAFARRQLNATILPDGKVLVTGGTQASGFNDEFGRVLEGEIWDPATGLWTTVAAMKVPRLYHSTSLLLADGTVLTAGGGMAGENPPYTNYPNAQIYSPPYLFKGDRPVVTSAPKILSYGGSFSVETPDAAKIQQVTLVRLGSVTHAFDQSQRFARLSFVATADGLTVTAPATSKVCPPGPYLLFLLNQAGVPSVGRFISLPG